MPFVGGFPRFLMPGEGQEQTEFGRLRLGWLDAASSSKHCLPYGTLESELTDRNLPLAEAPAVHVGHLPRARGAACRHEALPRVRRLWVGPV